MAYKCDHSSCKRMKNDLEGEALPLQCPARAAAGTVNSRESDVPTSSGGQSQIRNSKVPIHWSDSAGPKWGQPQAETPRPSVQVNLKLSCLNQFKLAVQVIWTLIISDVPFSDVQNEGRAQISDVPGKSQSHIVRPLMSRWQQFGMAARTWTCQNNWPFSCKFLSSKSVITGMRRVKGS